MLRSFLLPLVVCPLLSFSNTLFESNFEHGETYLAKPLFPGAKSIHLLAGEKLNDWPVDGGTGIVGFHLPNKSDTFSYTHRKGATLKGVIGLRHAHPQWTGVRTMGFKQWLTPKGYWRTAKVANIHAETANPLEGAFSASVDFNTDTLAYLSHELPELPTDSFYCRIQIRLDQELLGQETYACPFLYVKTASHNYPGIVPRQRRNSNVTLLELSKPPRGEILRREAPAGPFELKANETYCVEIGFLLTSPNRVITTLWVDGKPASQTLSSHVSLHGRMPSIAVGKLLGSRALKGAFHFDDIVLSYQRLGPVPLKPSISFAGNALVSSSLQGLFDDDHAASHWQIAAGNAWLLPIFSTGEDHRRRMQLPHPHYLEISDSLNHQIVYRQPYRIPTGIVPEKEYLARVKHRHSNGNWGDWSIPCTFSVSNTESILPEKRPEIHDAWFARPGGKRKQEEIVPGKWYDFHVHFTPSSGLAIEDGFLDINFSGDPENNTLNYANRAKAFRARDNYLTSLSFVQRCAYVKQIENSRSYQDLCGRTGKYFDDADGQYQQDLSKGRITIRTRILEQAIAGPWKMSVYLKEDGPGLSRVFEDIFLVRIPEQKGRPIGQWAWGAILLVAGALLLWGWQRLMQSKRIGKPSPMAMPEKNASLPLSEHIRKAIDHIERNYKKPILPRDVAEAIGVTPNWLGKLFKRETGRNLIDHLAEFRVEEAKRLLRETKMDVAEIAFNSGFNSVPTFHRTFRAFEKQSPLSYRRASQ